MKIHRWSELEGPWKIFLSWGSKWVSSGEPLLIIGGGRYELSLGEGSWVQWFISDVCPGHVSLTASLHLLSTAENIQPVENWSSDLPSHKSAFFLQPTKVLLCPVLQVASGASLSFLWNWETPGRFFAPTKKVAWIQTEFLVLVWKGDWRLRRYSNLPKVQQKIAFEVTLELSLPYVLCTELWPLGHSAQFLGGISSNKKGRHGVCGVLGKTVLTGWNDLIGKTSLGSLLVCSGGCLPRRASKGAGYFNHCYPRKCQHVAK